MTSNLKEAQYDYMFSDSDNQDFDLTDFVEPSVDAFDPDMYITRSEQVLKHQIDDLGADPSKPISGKGPVVHIGFDSEFVSGTKETDNNVLSLQFYLIGEFGQVMTRVIYPKSSAKKDRPCFDKIISTLIIDAIENGVILEWPRRVVLCGFFLRIDLPAFGDLVTFKNQLSNIGGRVATGSQDVEVTIEEKDRSRLLNKRTVLDSDRDGIYRSLRVSFTDLGGHVAVGTSLAQIGDLLELPKLELPDGYTKDRMDLFLQGDKQAFEAYGLRDAEIAVRFYQRLEAFATTTLGCKSLASTASGQAVSMFRSLMGGYENADEFNALLGTQTVTHTYWNSRNARVDTKKENQQIPMRAIFEPFVAQCYSGGRNECYTFGPSEVSVYNDFDLAGAYTTGLVDLRHIDYNHFRTSYNPADYLGHVLGFAYVKFAFPNGTRFPSLPVRNKDDGLIYPLTGYSYCTAPEIEVAFNQHCKLEIQYGVIVPWLQGDARMFEPYVTEIRRLRKSFVKGSLDELYVKLLGNSLYGKTAQGLKNKVVFEAGSMKSIELPHSAITNAAIAAHTTGFVRAVLSEQIVSIPQHRKVISATTDGFITDAEESELVLDGAVSKRFKSLCHRVAPDSKMLEQKHKVKQVIAMKTRGQLTGLAYEDEPVILAKAGVSTVADNEDHNQYMVDLFLNRKPDDITMTHPFTSFREQWVKDTDVVRLTREKKLNLEYDFKRRLVNPSMIKVGEVEHIAFDSVPWQDIHESERARAIFNGWRKQHCLKTLDDHEDWDDHYQFALVRDKLSSSGVEGFGLRATNKGVADVLRRLFLRCYTQELCGLSRSMKYREIAEWLTNKGYPTSDNDVKNAKRAKFIENVVPATSRVMKLATVLSEGFPSIEINKFLQLPK